MRNDGLQLTLKTTFVILVAAFFVVFLMLVTALQQFLVMSSNFLRHERSAVAETAFNLAGQIGSRPDDSVQQEMETLRASFGVAWMHLDRRGHALRSGEQPVPGPASLRVNRGDGTTTATVVFSATPLDRLLQTHRKTSAAMIAAAALAAVLMLLHFVILSRNIVSVVGRESEEATDYVIKTFSTSLSTLKTRTTELTRLHDMAKARADELEHVTAMLVRSLSSGFMAVDSEGNVLDLNAAAREILGVPASVDPLARTVSDLVGDGEFSAAVAAAIRARATLQRVEVHHTRPSPIVIGLSTIPLLDEDSRYLGMLVLFTDLSPIRELETRVRDMESLAAIGELSAGIAHEFRNSLATILGYLRLVRKNTTVPVLAEHVRHAEEECVELSGAVERLLTFARPMALQKQPVDVHQLLGELLERARGVREDVSLVLEGETLVIDADPTLLARALENLIRNAIESIAQKGAGSGRVTARTSATPRPTITIADDGAGISSEVRLFLPFQSSKPNGFGLGLAMAKKIVLLHHGTIRLVPNEAGGATAEIEFHEEPPGTAVLDRSQN